MSNAPAGRRLLAGAVVAATALAGLAACDGDGDEAATTTTTSTTTTVDVGDDEGVTATVDSLCAQVADLRALARDLEAPERLGDAADVLSRDLQELEEGLADLGGEDRTDQLQQVQTSLEDAMDTFERALEEAADGNFGDFQDLLGEAMDALEQARDQAADLGFQACAPDATTTTGNEADADTTTTTG